MKKRQKRKAKYRQPLLPTKTTALVVVPRRGSVLVNTGRRI